MINKKTVIYFFTLTFFNLLLMFILTSILTGDLLQYQTGFYLVSPFLIASTLAVCYFSFPDLKNYKTNRLMFWAAFNFLLINSLFLWLNYKVWIDLFDGSSQILVP